METRRTSIRCLNRSGFCPGTRVVLAALMMTAMGAVDLRSQESTKPDLRSRSNEVVKASLPLLQKSADLWIQRKQCASCHHQGLGMLAVSVAAEKGFDFSSGLLLKQVAATRRSAARSAEWNGQQEGPINGGFGTGYALLGLRAAGELASPQTDIHAYFLSGLQESDGAWRSSSHRLPLEDSHFTATALGVFALQSYGLVGKRRDRQLAAASKWLASTETLEHEDAVWQIWGLYWAGAGRSTLDPLLDQLAATQSADGSWSQYSGRPGDAYATGQALALLQQVRGDRVGDTTVERGAEWLITSWSADDSAWRVPSRRRFPGLPYFETGFPYGENQFISYAASAWAVTALALVAEPGPARALIASRPIEQISPSVASTRPMANLPELVRSALYDSVEAFARALEAATDQELLATGPMALTALMAAVDDPAKVELLIARGVDVNVASEVGKTALHLAAGRWGTGASMERLLAAGAKVDVVDTLNVTPLHHAVRSADVTRIRRLLQDGADHSRWGRGDTVVGHPLFQAAMAGSSEVATALLAAGVGMTARYPEFGSTALHEAVVAGSESTVRVLLDASLDPNLVDQEGNTALHYAVMVYRGSDQVVRALLGAGADPALRNQAKATAADLARADGHRALLPLLD